MCDNFQLDTHGLDINNYTQTTKRSVICFSITKEYTNGQKKLINRKTKVSSIRSSFSNTDMHHEYYIMFCQ